MNKPIKLSYCYIGIPEKHSIFNIHHLLNGDHGEKNVYKKHACFNRSFFAAFIFLPESHYRTVKYIGK
jgi:hypothetical protein